MCQGHGCCEARALPAKQGARIADEWSILRRYGRARGGYMGGTGPGLESIRRQAARASGVIIREWQLDEVTAESE